MNNLRIFGQQAIIKKSKNYIDGKFDSKGQRARFVGYTDVWNTYRFLIPPNKIKISCDAVFLNDQNEQVDQLVSPEYYHVNDDDWDQFVQQDDKPDVDPNAKEKESNGNTQKEKYRQQQTGTNKNLQLLSLESFLAQKSSRSFKQVKLSNEA